MKSLRILFSIALLSVSAMAFAQSDAHNHAAQSDDQSQTHKARRTNLTRKNLSIN